MQLIRNLRLIFLGEAEESSPQLSANNKGKHSRLTNARLSGQGLNTTKMEKDSWIGREWNKNNSCHRIFLLLLIFRINLKNRVGGKQSVFSKILLKARDCPFL